MDYPVWYDGKSVNEVEFCTEFVQKRPLKCIGGRLFGIDGEENENDISFYEITQTFFTTL